MKVRHEVTGVVLSADDRTISALPREWVPVGEPPKPAPKRRQSKK